MKTLTSRTVFICATSSFSSSSTYSCLPSSCCVLLHSINNEVLQRNRGGASHFSSYSSAGSSSSWRHHDEDSRNVRISVWWDFENCTVPSGINVFRVAQRITSALRANGLKGPVAITAFGDVSQLSRAKQEALSATGICLNHIPRGGKNSADRSLLVDLVYWVSQNPPPAHLFLISSDRDFANILHRLRMNNYNILLASAESAPGVLCSAASIMWHWDVLVKGENLIGKHFNQPPDGPYGSWYGHYKGPLEDPFLDMEQPACLQPEDSLDPGTDSKSRPVPKAFVNRIRQILSMYPKGISISDLRSELGKSNVTMDKDFFGHKKFSRLLLSMPTVLKLRPAGDGLILVHGVRPKAAETVESNSKLSTVPETSNGSQDQTVPETSNGDRDGIDIMEVNTGDNAVSADLKEKLPLPTSSPVKPEEPLQPVHKDIDALPTMCKLTTAEGQISEMGFFQGIWRKWFRNKNDAPTDEDNSISAECSDTVGTSDKTKCREKSPESTNHNTDQLDSISSSSNAKESASGERITRSPEENCNNPRLSMGIINRFVNWCKFWRTSLNPDKANEHCCKELNQTENEIINHELFSKDFLWDDVELFVHSPKGSALISQSKTREQMAEWLQKEGPIVLSSLSTSDLICLVNLLISEKKWIGEHPSETFPFRIIAPAGRKASPRKGSCSNGLSSIFSDIASQASLQRPEHESGKAKNTGAVFAESKRTSEKSRTEILTNCQKLVAEILEEHPDGFNMGCFKKLFLERYGYVLDYQMLGYQKLAALLQNMPGVRIESTYILPVRSISPDCFSESIVPCSLDNSGTGKAVKLDSELSGSSRKDNDRDCVWEELGPIKTGSHGNVTVSGLDRKANKEPMEMEPVDVDANFLSEEEFSDMEKDNKPTSCVTGQVKARTNEEESSLLQILDSWYSSKDDDGRKHQSQNGDELVDCSKTSSVTSGSSELEVKGTPVVTNCGHKLRPLKKYSFVSDQVGDDKEKVIDNILGSLKKSTESRIRA
ncbi:PREDICTED: uncharacterized protein LOC104599913 [Nelumbo nucifera]|uniref:Uncharacterized protein LOC104599913 n=2 Tax=Nelumbo nucifera TaxID=4432 RepID=A0A1U8A7D4_NELNU|nr:PREDICTED: uncharacterized protein LOC104599913 [Nelumbo nucifera]DAD40064.1 TPA_asm: hypothetical protein HUJ06_014387 [Nelumbo nucifera]